LESEEVSSIDI